jgi:hypothetical protein
MSTTGQCLCGAVKFSAEGVPHDVTACHCSMCRRWTGGPDLAVEAESVTFDGEENIGRYRSSAWAERGFCKVCGSNLFYRLVEADRYLLAPGAFDDQSGFRMTLQVFVDDKPGYYSFADETEMMTGAEVFAMYAPKQDG